MKKIILIVMLTAFSVALFSQNFRATSINVITTAPDSCSSIQVDINTFLGCINFTQGPATYTVSGSNIDIDVNYTSSPICLGAISNPVFNVSLSNIPSGTYTITATALLDAIFQNSISSQNFVVAACSTVGLDEFSENNFEVYPNPTKDIVNISSSKGSYEVNVLDMKGSSISNVSLINKGDYSTLDISSLNSGIYFLEIRTENKVIMKKIVKQ